MATILLNRASIEQLRDLIRGQATSFSELLNDRSSLSRASIKRGKDALYDAQNAIQTMETLAVDLDGKQWLDERTLMDVFSNAASQAFEVQIQQDDKKALKSIQELYEGVIAVLFDQIAASQKRTAPRGRPEDN